MKRVVGMKRMAMTVALVLIAESAFAQSHQPYAGLQSRPVKALSEQQIADLRAGRGMTMALPAELNGYPGPLHVIELADALALSSSQIARMQRLYDDMKGEAVALGERLIAQETELDRQFAGRTVTASTLVDATNAIGMTQGELRGTHLRYHLLAVELLTRDQLRRYAELRGYRGSEPGQMHQSHPH
jgi:hypothetical protein